MRRLPQIAILLVPMLFATEIGAQVAPWTDESPHEVRSIAVTPTVHLEVLDWGGTGEVLVFLAGLSQNAHTYDEFAPRFTDRYRVMGITRRGHGHSSWPDAGYELATLVQDLQATLDSLGFERVFLVGHSYGGIEITKLAAEAPDRVAGLIYIDAIQDLTQMAAVMPACPAGQEFEEVSERSFENPEAFRQTQRRIGDDGTPEANASAAAVGQIVRNLERPDYSRVSAPALAVSYIPERVEDIFFGMANLSDACVSAAQRLLYEGLASFARGMERGRIVALQDGQHNLHLVVPNELEAAMRRWLAEQLEG